MKLLLPFQDWPEYPKGIPKYAISQRFGENPTVYAKFGWQGHNGADLAAPLATPVLAMHDGWIVEARAKDTGYGIRLTHYFEEDGFGWDITYGHFQKVNYPDIAWDKNRRDYPVKEGSVIGYVDSTGFSSGNHLHVTLRQWKDGVALNQDNGFGGAIDPFPFISNLSIMTNSFLVQRGGEYGLYDPAISKDGLISMMKNRGIEVPTTTNDKDFWDEINALVKGHLVDK